MKMDKFSHLHQILELFWAELWCCRLSTMTLTGVIIYLHNYFNLHICPSLRRRTSCHTFRFPMPAVVSPNFSNNSCLACVQSEKYSFWFTLRPLGSIRWGEAELRIIRIIREGGVASWLRRGLTYSWLRVWATHWAFSCLQIYFCCLPCRVPCPDGIKLQSC